MEKFDPGNRAILVGRCGGERDIRQLLKDLSRRWTGQADRGRIIYRHHRDRETTVEGGVFVPAVVHRHGDGGNAVGIWHRREGQASIRARTRIVHREIANQGEIARNRIVADLFRSPVLRGQGIQVPRDVNVVGVRARIGDLDGSAPAELVLDAQAPTLLMRPVEVVWVV